MEQPGDVRDHRQDQYPSQSSIKQQDGSKVYPSTEKLIPTMIALYMVFFLVALDRNIIGTAIPSISAQFDSFGDIAWYESGFLLPFCALSLFFGLLLRHYSTKWVIFTLAAIFEIGSIVCATAPNSKALIVGRVITGIGGAGIGSGVYLFVTLLVPLQSRPSYLGSLGACFGISSILGPILGGYLTSVTWRWCFWINVPIGGVALFLLALIAPNPPAPTPPAPTVWGKFLELDPIGFILIAPSVICLLFALEIGGQTQQWSQGRIIALFIVFGVLLIAFILYAWWRGDKATIPPRIINHRSIIVACVLTCTIGSALVLYPFFLPIWFQVVQGKTPQASGLSLLPLFLSVVICVVGGGVLISKIGYYTPLAIVGGAFLVAGSATITTWSVDIAESKWIGYQIIVGIGIGLSLQQPALAIQTILDDSDIAVGTSLLNLFTYLGGTVFITVGQALLEQKLDQTLSQLDPNIDPTELAGSGATSLKNLVPSNELDQAYDDFNTSLKSVWYLALALSCVVFIFSFGLEWKSVKKEKRTDEESHGECRTEDDPVDSTKIEKLDEPDI